MINFVIVSPGEMPPRILVKKGEKWIKHVYCDGARFHVLSWMLVNSKGVRYGDLDAKTLSFMYSAIAKHERNEDNIRKMDAIKVILAARGTAA